MLLGWYHFVSFVWIALLKKAKMNFKKIESTALSQSFPLLSWFCWCWFKNLFTSVPLQRQSYIGSFLNSPPSVPLQRVPHQNSMPDARRLGLRRTSAGGSSLRLGLNANRQKQVDHSRKILLQKVLEATAQRNVVFSQAHQPTAKFPEISRESTSSINKPVAGCHNLFLPTWFFSSQTVF